MCSSSYLSLVYTIIIINTVTVTIITMFTVHSFIHIRLMWPVSSTSSSATLPSSFVSKFYIMHTVNKYRTRYGPKHTHMFFINIPMMLPRAQTACSQTFWWGDSSSCRNKGTAPVNNPTSTSDKINSSYYNCISCTEVLTNCGRTNWHHILFTAIQNSLSTT